MESLLIKMTFFVEVKKRPQEALFALYKKGILIKSLQCIAGLATKKQLSENFGILLTNNT
jgi:hypothetical protein